MSEFPEPANVELTEADYPELHSKGLKPVVLTRLTIVINDNDFLIHYNKSEVVSKYDLLAIVPKNSVCLSNLLKSAFRFDILSFRPDCVRDGVKWQRKLYNECVDKYVHFELMYSPAITSREERRNIISLAQTYQTVGKSKKVVLTSGARFPLELRAPFDVSNLAFLLGLNENQGKAGVKQHCQDVYKAALGRKLGVFRVRVEKIGEQSSDEDDYDESDNDSDSMDAN